MNRICLFCVTAVLAIFSLGVTVASAATTYSAKDLGTLGGTFNYGSNINASVRFTGFGSTHGDADSHAFLYNGSTLADLGTLGDTDSFGDGINSSGQVVGESYIIDDADFNAFLHGDSNMLDSNSLLDLIPGTTLLAANVINDSGQIVALRLKASGQADAYGLTPLSTRVPLPVGLPLLVSAIGALALARLHAMRA